VSPHGLRRARPADVAEIERIWDPDLSDFPEDAVWWIARDAEGVACYCAANIQSDGEATLVASWTRPSARGRGWQRRMIRARMRWARAEGLDRAVCYTWGGNLPSIRALIRCGFVPVRREWDGERSWLWWSRSL
jgi:RimJ/RimL family protein N-acetyltransferase